MLQSHNKLQLPAALESLMFDLFLKSHDHYDLRSKDNIHKEKIVLITSALKILNPMKNFAGVGAN